MNWQPGMIHVVTHQRGLLGKTLLVPATTLRYYRSARWYAIRADLAKNGVNRLTDTQIVYIVVLLNWLSHLSTCTTPSSSSLVFGLVHQSVPRTV